MAGYTQAALFTALDGKFAKWSWGRVDQTTQTWVRDEYVAHPFLPGWRRYTVIAAEVGTDGSLTEQRFIVTHDVTADLYYVSSQPDDVAAWRESLRQWVTNYSQRPWARVVQSNGVSREFRVASYTVVSSVVDGVAVLKHLLVTPKDGGGFTAIETTEAIEIEIRG